MPHAITSVRSIPGNCHQVNGEGNSIIRHAQGTQQVHNALHVRGVRKNLLSVGMLADKGYVVFFTSQSCWIATNTSPSTILAKGIRDNANGLYRLLPPGTPLKNPSHCPRPELPQPGPPQLLLTAHDKTKLWHRRLGHINYWVLHAFSKSGQERGLPHLPSTQVFCKECVHAKQQKTAAPKQSSNRATHPFQLLHTDLCGPFTTPSLGGSKYSLALTDNYSRRTWTFFLPTKETALNKFQAFKATEETHYRIRAL